MMRERYFRRQQRENDMPTLNTASLPDLIFTVLFFFMIVTHMRDVDLKVRYETPQGTELQELRHKAAVANIYIGRNDKGDFVIQLNDKLSTVDDINAFVEEERSKMSADDQPRMIVNIRADRDTPLGVIADVKQALQQAFALKISYAAKEKDTN